jgi:hypothetical protein
MLPSVLGVAVYALEIAVALSALALSRKRRDYTPVAVFLLVAVAADLIRWGLSVGPLREPGPYSGPTRMAFHIDQACFMAPPFGLAALAWYVYLRKPPNVPAFAYPATAAIVAVSYPELRQTKLGWVYAGVHAAATLTAIICAAIWTVRRGTSANQRSMPSLAHIATLLLTLLSLTAFVGPYIPTRLTPFADWPLGQVVNLLIWVSVGLLQVRYLAKKV